MKTKLSIVYMISLLIAACGEKADKQTAELFGNDDGRRGTCGGVLLTTDLPPEVMIGTPCPVILPLPKSYMQ